MIKDVTATSVQFNKKLTLNLNGCVIRTVDGYSGSDALIVVGKFGDLTIGGDGNITVATQSKKYARAFQVSGKLTINSGVISNTEPASTDAMLELIYVVDNKADLTINGGTFISKTPAWTVNIFDTSVGKAKVAIKGGTFKKFNPSDANDGNLMSKGYKVEEKEESGVKYYTVVEDISEAAEKFTNYPVWLLSYKEKTMQKNA